MKAGLLDKVKAKIDGCPIEFTFDSTAKVSKAGGALCNWILNWHEAGSAMQGVSSINKQLQELDSAMAMKQNAQEET